VVPAEDQGTVRREVPGERRGKLSLSEDSLRELAGLALRVEALFGSVPQDIEWAVADGKLYLLQARPMTGLPPAPPKDVSWEPPIPGTKWVRRQVAENMPEPLSPLFEELYVKKGLEDAVNGVWEMAEWKGDPEEVYDRPMYTTVNGYAYSRAAIKRSWKSAQIIMGIFATVYVRTFRRGISLWTEDFLPPYLATMERWKAVDPKTAPDEQLLEGVRELSYAEALYWYGTTIALALAKVSDVILNRFLATVVRRKGITSALFLRGFPTKAVEAEAELEAIAEQIRGSRGLRDLVSTTPAGQLLEALEAIPAGRPVQERLRLYLDRYGHLVYNLDFVEPTQAEAPMPVLMSLKALVRRRDLTPSAPLPGAGRGEDEGSTFPRGEGGRGARSDALARQAEMARQRDEMVERTARSLDPLRRRLFLKILRWAQRLTPYREEALFYLGSAWPPLRRLALELGRRLAESGSLARPDDVFFLESAELAEAIRALAAGRFRPDFLRLTRERRDLRTARKRLHPPAAVPPGTGLKFGPIDLSGLETQKRNTGAGPVLSGFAVSPGQVTAPASVILSPADFHKMEPGTILVCPTTTPAWTPLFAQARGLVTDIGGVAAHGSIVAREYGIPAVMGTGNGTQRIGHGQPVTVDGDAGTVTLVDKD